MFWTFLVVGLVSTLYGLLMVTNWRGFAETVTKVKLLPFMRHTAYGRVSGAVSMGFGLALVGWTVVSVR
jgi:hypothetical protein